MDEYKSGTRVKIHFCGIKLGTVIDHKDPNIEPKPSFPFTKIDDRHVYVLPDDTSGLENCTYYPYLVMEIGGVLLERVGAGNVCTSSPASKDICPDCRIAGEWIAGALKCPNCWKVW
jgi:hypothetical protein